MEAQKWSRGGTDYNEGPVVTSPITEWSAPHESYLEIRGSYQKEPVLILRDRLQNSFVSHILLTEDFLSGLSYLIRALSPAWYR